MTSTDHWPPLAFGIRIECQPQCSPNESFVSSLTFSPGAGACLGSPGSVSSTSRTDHHSTGADCVEAGPYFRLSSLLGQSIRPNRWLEEAKSVSERIEFKLIFRWLSLVLDANAVIPSGRQSEKLTSVGEYEQCLQIYDHLSNVPIYGRFCWLQVKPKQPTQPFRHSLALGLCVPAVCDASQLDKLFLQCNSTSELYQKD